MKQSLWGGIGIVLLLILLSVPTLTVPAHAQGSCNSRVTYIDKTNFPTVQVTISVTDASNNPITRLTTASFGMTENGQRVSLTTVNGGQAFSAVLVIDTSGSMDGTKIIEARSAATDFVNSMRTGDQIGIIPFADRPATPTPLTGNRQTLLNAINRLTAGGDTAFYDATIQAVNMLRGATGRRLVIAMTDGMDTASASNPDVVINAARAQANDNGIDIHTVGFGSASAGDLDETVLRNIASGTNGLYYSTAGSFSVQDIYNQIFQQVSSEYTFSYQSPQPNAQADERRIDVTANCNPGSASATSYYNPGNFTVAGGDATNSTTLFLVLGAVAVALIALLVLPRLFAGGGAAPSTTPAAPAGSRVKLRTSTDSKKPVETKRGGVVKPRDPEPKDKPPTQRR